LTWHTQDVLHYENGPGHSWSLEKWSNSLSTETGTASWSNPGPLEPENQDNRNYELKPPGLMQ